MQTSRSSLLNLLLLAVGFILTAAAAEAQSFYIRAGATGTGTGADWTNAFPAVPASFVRGATYYVAGGSYTGGTNFNTAPSGTTLIRFWKATVADHGTDTGWLNSYGNSPAVFSAGMGFQTSYWEVDGKTGQDRTGYGFECDTGGAGDGFFIATGATNITVKYCNVHAYPEGTSRLTLTVGNFHHGVYCLGATNVSFQHCYIHHFYGTCFLIRDLSNLLIEYCYLANNASTAAFHSEGISDNGSDNVIIRYNKWCDIDGTAFIACINGGIGATADTWDIYGNVFWHTGTYGSAVSAVITAIEDPSNHVHAKDWKIYNNTIATIYGVVAFSFNSPLTSNVQMFNNLLWQNRPDAAYANYINFIFAGIGNARNYNYFALCSFPFGNNNAINENLIFDGPNSRLSNAPDFPGFVNPAAGDFHPLGAIVSFPGISLPASYNKDMDGKTRGADGVWDIGAFESTGAGVGPIPPSNVRVSVLVQ